MSASHEGCLHLNNCSTESMEQNSAKYKRNLISVQPETVGCKTAECEFALELGTRCPTRDTPRHRSAGHSKRCAFHRVEVEPT
jgi:hypothetical protein